MMKRLSKTVPDLETAEGIGMRALVFLTEEPSRLSRFLGETGLTPDDLRARASEAPMLAAILEYLLGYEPELLVFTAGAGIDPQQIEPMRALLAGERRRWEPSV